MTAQPINGDHTVEPAVAVDSVFSDSANDVRATLAPEVAPVTNATSRMSHDTTFEQLDQLCGLLDTELDYSVPELTFTLPETFLLSVVMPVYNEQATLREIVARVARVPIRKELVLVDDCSTDGSREILRELEQIPEARVVYKSTNEGKGAALRTAFEHVRGDVVVVQDADLEYDPRDIPRLLEPIVAGQADVVYGSRFLAGTDQDPSRLHRVGNALLTAASNLATGLRLTDMETCYKAIRREVLEDIVVRQNRFGFEPEITAKLARRRCRFVEVPISYDSRGYTEGKKIGLRDAFEALFCILRYGLAD